MSNRSLLVKGVIFWVVFTACYGAFRLVKHDEWRWDHLAQSYCGMVIGFFIVWLISRNRQANG